MGIFGILIALFTTTFIVLSSQDPYSLNIKSYALNFGNIEASDLDAYELNASNVKSYYKAQSWARYTDKDELDNFINFNLDFNLSANKLELKGKKMDKALLEGNVTYIGLSNIKIFIDKVEYTPKNKILSANTGFKASINGSIINGNTLSYDIEKKILQVQGVNAWLER